MTAELLSEDAMEFSAGLDLGETYSCLHNLVIQLVENIREFLCIDLCKDSGSVGLPIIKQKKDPEMSVEDPGKQYQANWKFAKTWIFICSIGSNVMPRGFLHGKMVGVLVVSFRVWNSNFWYLFIGAVFGLTFEICHGVFQDSKFSWFNQKIRKFQ